MTKGRELDNTFDNVSNKHVKQNSMQDPASA